MMSRILVKISHITSIHVTILLCHNITTVLKVASVLYIQYLEIRIHTEIFTYLIISRFLFL